MFKTSDFRDTGSIHFSRIPCRSRSLFFLGGGGGGRRRFELNNEENGGDGSDGKREKRRYMISQAFLFLSFSFPSPPVRALRSFPSS